jgi:hypothetical protein
MAEIIAKIVESDTITCPSCKKTYDAWELESGIDWFFEWDNYDILTGEQLRKQPISQDLCFNCFNTLKEKEEDNNETP